MLDQGEQDDKIIGVHADDPGRFHQIVFVARCYSRVYQPCQFFSFYITEYRDYTDISQLPPHRLLEIKRYKKLLLEIVCVCCARTVLHIYVGFSKITRRMRRKRSRLTTF